MSFFQKTSPLKPAPAPPAVLRVVDGVVGRRAQLPEQDRRQSGFPGVRCPGPRELWRQQRRRGVHLRAGASPKWTDGLWAGWCLDRWGPRRVLWVGALMSGGGFLALGYTTRLWAFGVLYLLVVTVGTDLGFSYALSAVMNNWFYRRKAFAMSAFQAIDSVLPAGPVGAIAPAVAPRGWPTPAPVLGLRLPRRPPPLAARVPPA